MKIKFAEVKPGQYQFVDRATKYERWSAVSGLPNFQNKEIDRTIYRIYKKATEPGIEEDHSTAADCIELLAGKGHDAEFRGYLKQSIAAMKKVGDPKSEWTMAKAQKLLDELNQ